MELAGKDRIWFSRLPAFSEWKYSASRLHAEVIENISAFTFGFEDFKSLTMKKGLRGEQPGSSKGRATEEEKILLHILHG